MIVLKPNEKRAKTAILLIVVVVVIEIISLLFDIMQYEMLQIGFTSQEAENNDLRQTAISVLFLIAFITSAVTFILWFRRAYYNLHQRVNYIEHSEGWAAGSWFVPFVNWFRPYQIMKELYVETEKFLRKNDSSYSTTTKTTTVNWWWTIWIISTIIDRISFNISQKAETLEEFNTSTIWSIISSLVTILSAILAIKVIKEYSEIEKVFHHYREPNEKEKFEILDSDENLEEKMQTCKPDSVFQ